MSSDKPLTAAALDALSIAHTHGSVFAGPNCYDGRSITRVQPSVILSLIRRGLLERFAYDTLAAKLTPAGNDARKRAYVARGEL